MIERTEINFHQAAWIACYQDGPNVLFDGWSTGPRGTMELNGDEIDKAVALTQHAVSGASVKSSSLFVQALAATRIAEDAALEALNVVRSEER